MISAARANRPNEFVESAIPASASTDCPFCPGHEELTPPEVLSYRQPGSRLWSLRVVPNKYPAIRMQAHPEIIGGHEVIIESPQHAASLGERLFQAVQDRIVYWRQIPGVRYVQFFKNSGQAAGASLKHPHSQLIALPIVPKRVLEELNGAREYRERYGRCFFCELLEQEHRDGARLIVETDEFQAIAPWAPRFGFEAWILPKRHASHFDNIALPELEALWRVLRILIDKLDQAAHHPAYNLLLHSAPLHDGELAYYHWHLEILPRITSVAGFEFATGCYIGTLQPEDYARLLRDAPGTA